MTENITSRNDNGQKHGYWELYYSNGNLCYKGFYKDGKEHGFWEEYRTNGKLDYKGFRKDGIKVGYWEWGNKIKFYIT